MRLRHYLLPALLAIPLAAISAVPAQGTIDRSPGRVTIARDDWGVPHVYAAREEDGYYGLGYATAEDRLENLLRRYLAAGGRLASVFGADSLEKDLWRLRWMHLEAARNSFSHFSPQLQRDYASYTAGIARYVTEHPEKTPAWAPKLDPTLPIAWNRGWLFDLGEAASKCAKGGAQILPEFAAAAPQNERPLAASNAWAVAPWRSADNAAILVGDSHSSFTGNGEMFEFHLDAGGIKLTGTSGLGNPWAVVGHTRFLAWTTTNRDYDVSDCYEIDVDPTNPRRYRFNGSWREMTVRTVTVPVRNSASVTRVFEYTSHNGVLSPVVGRRGSKAWVISSPYAHASPRFDEQMYAQMKARNLDEMITAERMNEMWPTNVMMAESGGNIYYLRAGRVPIRPTGPDWTRPVPGNTSATSWKGMYPVDSLVQIRNPVSGYMQNNNVSPDVMFEGSPMTADKYPVYVFSDRMGNTNFRAKRSVQLLSRTFRATMESMSEILFDEKWDRVDLFTEGLRRALGRQPAFVAKQSPDWRAFAETLLQFDGFARKESVAALRHLYWRMAVAENIEVNREMVALTFADSVPGAKYDSAVTAAVAKAMGSLKRDFGSVDRALGDVHRTGRGGVSLPLGGYIGTIRVMVYGNPDSTGKKWVYSGQRQPLIVIFAHPVQSWSQLNFGQSGDPSSPHYSDQARLMSEKRLKSTYFEESELLKHIESRKVLDVP